MFRLDVDAFDLKFHAAQLYNVVLLELILLLGVAVGDVADDKVDFLESVAGVLQLLPGVRVLLVNVLRHEFFFLLWCHFCDLLNL